jgi:hypothetical protein
MSHENVFASSALLLVTTKEVAFVIAVTASTPAAALVEVGVTKIKSPVATAVVLTVNVPAASVPVPHEAFAAALWQTFRTPVTLLEAPKVSFAVVVFIGVNFASTIGDVLTDEPLEPVPKDWKEIACPNLLPVGAPTFSTKFPAN